MLMVEDAPAPMAPKVTSPPRSPFVTTVPPASRDIQRPPISPFTQLFAFVQKPFSAPVQIAGPAQTAPAINIHAMPSVLFMLQFSLVTSIAY